MSEWACPACTLLNSHDVTTCNVCGALRPDNDDPSSNGAWACPQCTFLNQSGRVCSVCEGPRPRLQDTKKKESKKTNKQESKAKELPLPELETVIKMANLKRSCREMLEKKGVDVKQLVGKLEGEDWEKHILPFKSFLVKLGMKPGHALRIRRVIQPLANQRNTAEELPPIGCRVIIANHSENAGVCWSEGRLKQLERDGTSWKLHVSTPLCVDNPSMKTLEWAGMMTEHYMVIPDDLDIEPKIGSSVIGAFSDSVVPGGWAW
mmetsp:Transcript_27394/g.53144  ORF Transcript_27394/g.53144 Transcript_27394/m.53144 type:complete len:263 (+) Transcript_27394:38-826(+)